MRILVSLSVRLSVHSATVWDITEELYALLYIELFLANQHSQILFTFSFLSEKRTERSSRHRFLIPGAEETIFFPPGGSPV